MPSPGIEGPANHFNTFLYNASLKTSLLAKQYTALGKCYQKSPTYYAPLDYSNILLRNTIGNINH